MNTFMSLFSGTPPVSPPPSISADRGEDRPVMRESLAIAQLRTEFQELRQQTNQRLLEVQQAAAAAGLREENAVRDLEAANLRVTTLATGLVAARRNPLESLFQDCVDQLIAYDADYIYRGFANVKTVAEAAGAGAVAGCYADSQAQLKKPVATVAGCLLGTGVGIGIVVHNAELRKITLFVQKKLQEARNLCEREKVDWKPTKNLPPEGKPLFLMIKKNKWWEGVDSGDQAVKAILADQNNVTNISQTTAAAPPPAAASAAVATAHTPVTQPVLAAATAATTRPLIMKTVPLIVKTPPSQLPAPPIAPPSRSIFSLLPDVVTRLFSS
jgi:hypothetical protein